MATVKSLQRIIGSLSDTDYTVDGLSSERGKKLLEKFIKECGNEGRGFAMDENDHSKGSGLTGEDVLNMNEFQLMSTLDISLGEARKLLHLVAKQVVPRIITVNALLAGAKTLTTPLSVVRPRYGELVEIAGRAGVGKTQMCMTCAVDVVAAAGNDEGIGERSVVYIDTENKFNVQRVFEILKARMKGAEEEEQMRLAGRIIVHTPKSIQSLISLLDNMEKDLIERNVGLVLLDSIAALVNKLAYQHHRPAPDHVMRRQNMLTKVAAKLKFLAESCHLPIIVTNQVFVQFANNINSQPFIQTFERYGDDNSNNNNGETNVLMSPSLGNTWSHCVNARVFFETISVEDQLKRARVVKSPTTPNISCDFVIAKNGIQEV